MVVVLLLGSCMAWFPLMWSKSSVMAQIAMANNKLSNSNNDIPDPESYQSTTTGITSGNVITLTTEGYNIDQQTISALQKKPANIIFLLEQAKPSGSKDTGEDVDSRYQILTAAHEFVSTLPDPDSGQHNISVLGYGRINNYGVNDTSSVDLTKFSGVERRATDWTSYSNTYFNLNTGYYYVNGGTSESPTFDFMSSDVKSSNEASANDTYDTTYTRWTDDGKQDTVTATEYRPTFSDFSNSTYKLSNPPASNKALMTKAQATALFSNIGKYEDTNEDDQVNKWFSGAARLDAGLVLADKLITSLNSNQSPYQDTFLIICGRSCSIQENGGVYSRRFNAANQSTDSIKNKVDETAGTKTSIYAIGNYKSLTGTTSDIDNIEVYNENFLKFVGYSGITSEKKAEYFVSVSESLSVYEAIKNILSRVVADTIEFTSASLTIKITEVYVDGSSTPTSVSDLLKSYQFVLEQPPNTTTVNTASNGSVSNGAKNSSPPSAKQHPFTKYETSTPVFDSTQTLKDDNVIITLVENSDEAYFEYTASALPSIPLEDTYNKWYEKYSSNLTVGNNLVLTFTGNKTLDLSLNDNTTLPAGETGYEYDATNHVSITENKIGIASHVLESEISDIVLKPDSGYYFPESTENHISLTRYNSTTGLWETLTQGESADYTLTIDSAGKATIKINSTATTNNINIIAKAEPSANTLVIKNTIGGMFGDKSLQFDVTARIYDTSSTPTPYDPGTEFSGVINRRDGTTENVTIVVVDGYVKIKGTTNENPKLADSEELYIDSFCPTNRSIECNEEVVSNYVQTATVSGTDAPLTIVSQRYVSDPIVVQPSVAAVVSYVNTREDIVISGNEFVPMSQIWLFIGVILWALALVALSKRLFRSIKEIRFE